MIELSDFYYDGTGWICRHCERRLPDDAARPEQQSRFFREGEAENKTPELVNRALAKWTDKTQRFLICPQCGVVEAVEKS